MSKSTTEIINEEPIINEPAAQEDLGATQEDRFFGVQTEVGGKETSNLEVQIIDDTPEEDRRPKKSQDSDVKVDDDQVDKEISDYSQRAADRINQIKYEYHEERRAKEAAERLSQEATNRLQTILQENQRLQKTVDQGGQVLNQTVHNNALWAKQNAQDQFKKAYEEGDADAMSKAQELLSKATLAEQQSGTTAQQVQSRISAEMQAVQPEQQIRQQQLDPDMDRWSKKNPWFMSTSEPIHKTMTSYAMFVDQRLTEEGVDPATQSDKYYQSVDNAMRNEFPSFFGVKANGDAEMVAEQKTSKRQPQTVVASATRDSGNKKPTQIRLTKTQVSLARQLGITPEQYANQLLKES